MKVVDTRGEKCPKPIIDTRKALKETGKGEIFRVLTDSKTSFNNISRFLTDNKISFSVSEEGGIWTFEVKNESGPALITRAEDYCETGIQADGTGNYAISISSEFMGNGDDALGKKLMRSFFVALSVTEPLPSVIVFYNSGVKLASPGSDVLPLLKEIEDKGVEMIFCGTCTDYYNLTDTLNIGKIGDMYFILGKLTSADKVIRP
ncbi:MAG: sulfurtransferase-like selenium metabolism protein YedF [Bacteroidales bacterium]